MVPQDVSNPSASVGPPASIEAAPLTVTLTVSRRSFRDRLLALSIGVLLPAVVCAGWLLWAQSNESNRQYEQQLMGTARALSSAVDHKIAEAVAVNETLATSGRIRAGEYDLFRDRSVLALRGRSGWIVLSDEQGHQLVNTRLAAGVDPPKTPIARPRNVVLARQTGRTHVSDLTKATVFQKPIIAVDTPIPTPKGTYNLGYLFEPAVFVPLFKDQALAPGWVVALVDRNGRVIARSQGQEKFQGQSATGDLVKRMKQTDAAVLKSRSLDGVDMLTAFQRSKSTGWTLVTAVPRAQMQAATSRSLVRAGLLALLLLAASLFLSWLMSKGLNRQVEVLVEDASALAGGGVAPSRPGLMAELAAIQGAISRASQDLHAREQRHVLMVNELNHRVRNTLATVQALAAQSFRDRSGPEELAVFNGRLKGLATAHTLLSEVNWTETSVGEVLRRCQSPLDERVSMSGPEITIPAHGGVALCMVVHELLTNSLKYGALSRAGGRVRVEWGMADHACRLVWREEGGPAVTPPTRKGFGTRLIERLVKQDLEGQSAFDYRPGGLVFTAEFRTGADRRWDPGLQAG